jgi:ubiquinone biosynthesis protein Coq4
MDHGPGTREAFEHAVVSGGGADEAVEASNDLRAGNLEARFRVAELMVHVAAVAPERLVDVYDGLTAGWYGMPPVADPVSAPASDADVPDSFWEAFWALVDDPDAGRDPSDITVRTVALTGLMPADLPSRVAAMATRYPGVRLAAAGGLPGRFRLVDLERCPADSLGGQLYKLVVEGGFDLEVLDRDSLGLADMPPPLDYVNLRILQCHDVWHKVAGYETTGLHEVAISGFQMGQFGHHYSSTFLALVLTKASFSQPPVAAGFLLDTILSAYRHGRETPPMLDITWEKIWDETIEDIRRSQGITAYDSPYPAGILEELRPR